MLGDDALQASRAAFREQPVAVLERLRVKQLGDPGPLYQMAKPSLAVLEMDRAQVVTIELHEVERPQHQVVFDAPEYLTVQPLEPIRVDELGVDDCGFAG